jgi:hypothetical protein
VPLYIKYKVIDKKIDFKVIGGLSTNFLIGNNTYLNEDDRQSQSGKTDNINKINYSSTVGVGIEYPIVSQFVFTVEPLFKYYLNPINTNPEVNVYPYSVGILTGINYQF